MSEYIPLHTNSTHTPNGHQNIQLSTQGHIINVPFSKSRVIYHTPYDINSNNVTFPNIPPGVLPGTISGSPKGNLFRDGLEGGIVISPLKNANRDWQGFLQSQRSGVTYHPQRSTGLPGDEHTSLSCASYRNVRHSNTPPAPYKDIAHSEADEHRVWLFNTADATPNYLMDHQAYLEFRRREYKKKVEVEQENDFGDSYCHLVKEVPQDRIESEIPYCDELHTAQGPYHSFTHDLYEQVTELPVISPRKHSFYPSPNAVSDIAPVYDITPDKPHEGWSPGASMRNTRDSGVLVKAIATREELAWMTPPTIPPPIGWDGSMNTLGSCAGYECILQVMALSSANVRNSPSLANHFMYPDLISCIQRLQAGTYAIHYTVAEPPHERYFYIKSLSRGNGQYLPFFCWSTHRNSQTSVDAIPMSSVIWVSNGVYASENFGKYWVGGNYIQGPYVGKIRSEYLVYGALTVWLYDGNKIRTVDMLCSDPLVFAMWMKVLEEFSRLNASLDRTGNIKHVQRKLEEIRDKGELIQYTKRGGGSKTRNFVI